MSTETGDVRIENVQAYDAMVGVYAERTATLPEGFVEFRERFIACLGSGARVADIGCGPGRDADRFRRAGLVVVGIDASPGMAARARRSGTPMVLGDMRLLPCRVGVLDGIWASASLLHVPRRQVQATLRSWRCCLVDDGVLGISTTLGDHEGWEPVTDNGADPPRYDAGDLPEDASLKASGPLRRWFTYHRADALLALLDGVGFHVLSTEERKTHRHWIQIVARARSR